MKEKILNNIKDIYNECRDKTGGEDVAIIEGKLDNLEKMASDGTLYKECYEAEVNDIMSYVKFVSYNYKHRFGKNCTYKELVRKMNSIESDLEDWKDDQAVKSVGENDRIVNIAVLEADLSGNSFCQYPQNTYGYPFGIDGYAFHRGKTVELPEDWFEKEMYRDSLVKEAEQDIISAAYNEDAFSVQKGKAVGEYTIKYDDAKRHLLDFTPEALYPGSTPYILSNNTNINLYCGNNTDIELIKAAVRAADQMSCERPSIYLRKADEWEKDQNYFDQIQTEINKDKRNTGIDSLLESILDKTELLYEQTDFSTECTMMQKWIREATSALSFGLKYEEIKKSSFDEQRDHIRKWTDELKKNVRESFYEDAVQIILEIRTDLNELELYMEEIENGRLSNEHEENNIEIIP